MREQGYRAGIVADRADVGREDDRRRVLGGTDAVNGDSGQAGLFEYRVDFRAAQVIVVADRGDYRGVRPGCCRNLVAADVP
jgi:hypothetical protein